MSAFLMSQVVDGLKLALNRAKRLEDKYFDTPLHALALFPEGDADAMEEVDFGLIAKFLNVPAKNIHFVPSTMFFSNHRTTVYDGPIYAFQRHKHDNSNTDSSASFHGQFSSIRGLFAEIENLVRVVSIAHPSSIPAHDMNWWAIVFHLAIHFPAPYLNATRYRFLNILEQAPHAVGIWPFTPHVYRVPEFIMQLHGLTMRYSDVVKGRIWCELGEVLPATCAAIGHIISVLEAAPQSNRILQKPTEAIVDFQTLHTEFAEHSFVYFKECQVLKVSNTFRTSPAIGWCRFTLATRFDRLWLSRGNADIEYLLYRGIPLLFQSLSELAANLLGRYADMPVLFTRLHKMSRVIHEERAQCYSLNPDPVARWIRFVFNTLHEHADDTDVQVQFENAIGPWNDLVGRASLTKDLFAASARAIELAGLIPTLAEVGTPPKSSSPTGPPKKRKSGMPPLIERNPRLVNLYDAVLSERIEGRRGSKIIEVLLARRDIVELANDLGKTIDKALVKAAKTYRDNNPA